jgi:hypothetical protein
VSFWVVRDQLPNYCFPLSQANGPTFAGRYAIDSSDNFFYTGYMLVGLRVAKWRVAAELHRVPLCLLASLIGPGKRGVGLRP